VPDTVATPVLSLLHVPPGVASLNEIFPPGHTVVGPVTADVAKHIVTYPSPVLEANVGEPMRPVEE
jgi:hypothetical protein